MGLEFEGKPLDLPFGQAWCFVDKILSFNAQEYIIAQKYYAVKDPIVDAHFKDGPKIIPASLMQEQFLQAVYVFGVLNRYTGDENYEHDFLPLVSSASIRVIRPCYADNMITVKVVMKKNGQRFKMFAGEARQEDHLLAKVEATVTLKPL